MTFCLSLPSTQPVECAGALQQAAIYKCQSSVLSEGSCPSAGRDTSLYTAELSLEECLYTAACSPICQDLVSPSQCLQVTVALVG